MRTAGAVLLAGMLNTSCAGSPSVNVLGAYFPDWLFCIVAAVVLTILFHLTIERGHYDRWFGPLAVVYPTLVTLFALGVWLIFFQY